MSGLTSGGSGASSTIDPNPPNLLSHNTRLPASASRSALLGYMVSFLSYRSGTSPLDAIEYSYPSYSLCRSRGMPPPRSTRLRPRSSSPTVPHALQAYRSVVFRVGEDSVNIAARQALRRCALRGWGRANLDTIQRIGQICPVELRKHLLPARPTPVWSGGVVHLVPMHLTWSSKFVTRFGVAAFLVQLTLISSPYSVRAQGSQVRWGEGAVTTVSPIYNRAR